jgi:hypothetical protein
MIAPRFDDLRQHSDILRLRTGTSLTVRFVEPRDADALQGYFRPALFKRHARYASAIDAIIH